MLHQISLSTLKRESTALYGDSLLSPAGKSCYSTGLLAPTKLEKAKEVVIT